MVPPKSQSRPAPFSPDENQRSAISHERGPMLVVAGAGTGKTTVLTQRIAALVHDGHAQPHEILALTYTRYAAAEMRDRVRLLLGGKEIQAATFHDYCFGMLDKAGRKFGVLEETDLWIFLRRHIRELHLEHFVRAANIGLFLKDLLDFVSRCHDELVPPEKYADYVARLERGDLPIPRVGKSKDQIGDEEVLGRCREISRVYSTLENWLLERNWGSFSHMITRAYALLAGDPGVLAAEQARARFILVDEFQDANFAQIKILAALAGQQQNLFAVGDPDQSIYRFRGASSAAFQLFYRQFPDAKLVVLGKNRRSTTPILRCAFSVIDRNPQVFSGNQARPIAYRRSPLLSAREEEAAITGKTLASFPTEAISWADKKAEAADIAHIIEEIRRRLRCQWKDFGILYRIHSHRDEIVLELAQRDIPFTIESMDVSDTPEVRDLFACLAVAVDLGDDASLFRVSALPQFHVDPKQLRAALRAIALEAKEGQVIPLATVLDGVEGGREVLQTVYRARDVISKRNARGRQALEILAREFDLDPSSTVVQAALKFVADWERKATTATGELSELVEHLGYFREAAGVIPMTAEEDDAVRLMTVHLAKGLEFPHVFILRATGGSFPAGYRETLVEFPRELRDPDSFSFADDKTLHEQEERRLFYVAMTRAKDSLHIYGKEGTGKDKTPSAIPRELIKDSSLSSWLRSRRALPSQPELLTIAAQADTGAARGSQIPQWLALPPLEDLSLRLSASAVDTYERCPLQFKLEREWKLAREIPAAMQYGATMHRVLRTCYDAVRLGRPKSDDELVQLFREDLASSGIQDPYQHELYERQGIDQLREFLAAARSAPPPDVQHTEEWFDLQIGSTKVVGRIDRMDRKSDGTVVVVDYKTGKARSQEDADESLQLSIYAMAAREKWGYRVDSLVLYNLAENVPIITRRAEFQLADARERVDSAASNIAQGKFDPKPDFYCSFCAFRTLCPAREKHVPSRKSRRQESS